MLKFLGFLVVFAAIVGFAVPSLFFSDTFAAERTTTIGVSPAEVQATVADFSTWESWTAWNAEFDPTMERTITGTPGEVGHRMAWTSEQDMPGVIEITAIDAAKTSFVITFGEMPSSDTVIHHESNGEGATNVRWEMSGEIEGLPFMRYLGPLIEGQIGEDYQKGLTNLKARLEGGDAAPAGEGAGDGAEGE